MPNLLLCDASQPEITAPICKRTGLGVEIQSFSNPNYLQVKADGVQKHKNLYKDLQSRALHGPFGDLSPGSCDDLIREVTAKRFEFAYKYAQSLDAAHIILHHGYVPNTNTYGGWLRRSLEFWDVFLGDKDPRFTFYLENLLEPDGKLIGEVVRQIGRPNLRICLDVGHAFCYGKIPLQQWIEELGGLIGYVHLHDNHGDFDAHLSLGEGKIPLDQVCYTLKRCVPDAIWALEVGPEQTDDSLFWLQSHGYLHLSGV